MHPARTALGEQQAPKRQELVLQVALVVQGWPGRSGWEKGKEERPAVLPDGVCEKEIVPVGDGVLVAVGEASFELQGDRSP